MNFPFLCELWPYSNPRMGIEPRCVIESELAKEFAERMKTIHDEAQAALSKARDDMQRYADFN